MRGDLGAVVKAILLDEEARNLKRLNDPTWGMLREPFVRYTQLMRSFQAFSDTDEYYVDGYETIELLKQYPFHAPSVFNFFSPNYQPPGALKNVNLVAPEFQIMTAVTAISTINLWENTLFRDTAVEISPPQCEPMDEDENGDEIIDEAACERAYDENAIYFNFDHEYDLAHFPEELLEHLDLVLTYGTLSPKTKQIILDAITPLDDVEDRVRMAVYLMMISPEYAVLT